jgi:hypothetical protein
MQGPFASTSVMFDYIKKNRIATNQKPVLNQQPMLFLDHEGLQCCNI